MGVEAQADKKNAAPETEAEPRLPAAAPRDWGAGTGRGWGIIRGVNQKPETRMTNQTRMTERGNGAALFVTDFSHSVLIRHSGFGLRIPMRFYLRAIAYFRDDLPLILASLVLIGLSTLAAAFAAVLAAILIVGILGTAEHAMGVPLDSSGSRTRWESVSDQLKRQIIRLGDYGRGAAARAGIAVDVSAG